MENQEVLKAIATLVDKVGRYHERLLAVEREKEKLEKTLSEHLKGCSCHNPSTNPYSFLGVVPIISANFGAKILTSLRMSSSLVSV